MLVSPVPKFGLPIAKFMFVDPFSGTDETPNDVEIEAGLAASAAGARASAARSAIGATTAGVRLALMSASGRAIISRFGLRNPALEAQAGSSGTPGSAVSVGSSVIVPTRRP